jgi:hypothetical protein
MWINTLTVGWTFHGDLDEQYREHIIINHAQDKYKVVPNTPIQEEIEYLPDIAWCKNRQHSCMGKPSKKISPLNWI